MLGCRGVDRFRCVLVVVFLGLVDALARGLLP